MDDRKPWAVVLENGSVWLAEDIDEAAASIRLERISLGQLQSHHPRLLAALKTTSGLDAPRVVQEKSQ